MVWPLIRYFVLLPYSARTDVSPLGAHVTVLPEMIALSAGVPYPFTWMPYDDGRTSWLFCTIETVSLSASGGAESVNVLWRPVSVPDGPPKPDVVWTP